MEKRFFIVEHAKILGVTIKNQFKFDNHFKEICKNDHLKNGSFLKEPLPISKEIQRNLI